MNALSKLAPRRAANANRPLRIAMLVGSLSVRGGGVSEAMMALAVALRRRHAAEIEIFSPASDASEIRDANGIRARLFPVLGPSSFGYAPGLVDALVAGDFDAVHVHGLWMYISVAARRWSRLTGRPYLVSPHGMLDPWALRNSGWKKRIARLAFEDAHLRGAGAIHALCAQEAEAIDRLGLNEMVKIIPNGVERVVVPLKRAPWRDALPRDAKVLLFLGRVTPKKRVAELVRAWCLVADAAPDWHLAIAGPVEPSYSGAIEEAVSADTTGRVHLLGPVYGEDRSAAYLAADAFILPSISEGLPMAALEAFSFALPALLTRECNLDEAFSARAAFRIGADVEGVAEGLCALFRLPHSERKAMGMRARDLAATSFDWGSVADRFVSLYRSLG